MKNKTNKNQVKFRVESLQGIKKKPLQFFINRLVVDFNKFYLLTRLRDCTLYSYVVSNGTTKIVNYAAIYNPICFIILVFDGSFI